MKMKYSLILVERNLPVESAYIVFTSNGNDSLIKTTSVPSLLLFPEAYKIFPPHLNCQSFASAAQECVSCSRGTSMDTTNTLFFFFFPLAIEETFSDCDNKIIFLWSEIFTKY